MFRTNWRNKRIVSIIKNSLLRNNTFLNKHFYINNQKTKYKVHKIKNKLELQNQIINKKYWEEDVIYLYHLKNKNDLNDISKLEVEIIFTNINHQVIGFYNDLINGKISFNEKIYNVWFCDKKISRFLNIKINDQIKWYSKE